jgi:hypothetical protein
MTIRMDNASPGVFLQRELEHILPKVYEKIYAEIPYTRIIPVSNEVPEGAETYKYEIYDAVGEFDLISDFGDDLPTSDVRRGEIVNTIRNFAGSFKYTTEEIRKAQFAKVSLEQRRADAVRESYERRANKVALFGYPGTGLKGFFNHPVVDKIVVTGSANDGWFDGSAVTPDNMLAILNEGITYQVNASKMVERPDTMLLPYSVYRKISTTARSTTSDTTVLEYFLRTNPYITQVEPINELDPANSGGALTVPRMVIYKRDAGKLQFHVPMPLKFHPPQPRNLAWSVPAEAKLAGVALYYPKSITYVDKG